MKVSCNSDACKRMRAFVRVCTKLARTGTPFACMPLRSRCLRIPPPPAAVLRVMPTRYALPARTP